MILLLSGEGPSDLGTCLSPGSECEGEAFKPGPMAWLVDKLVEGIWNYGPLGAMSCVLVPKGTLAAHCKKARMGTTLPGKKRGPETAYFFKNARGLAQMAQQKSKKDGCPVGAVLFRDADGTRSSQRSLWLNKVDSMEEGFKAEGFDFGVPMVPKPKSEAWLLCALQRVAYQSCERFEDLPGNDASPNSAKEALETALADRGKGLDDISEMIECGELDPQQIRMPSFDRFRCRLETVCRELNDAGRAKA